MPYRLSPTLGLLTLLGLWCGAVRAFELGEPYFETVGNAQSIPEGVVTALAEDASGMVWIGTADGLIRYDGYRFRLYDEDPEDPSAVGRTFIQALMPAHDGRIWIGNYAHGVTIYDPANGAVQQLRHKAEQPDSLASDTVRALAETAEGAVWIGTRDGLDYWRANTPRIEHFRHRTADAGSLNHDDISALLIDSRGALWVGSGDGLNRRAPNADGFERIPATGPAASQLAGQQINSLLEANDGRIWVLTRRGDYCIVDPRVEPPQASCIAASTAGFVRSVAGFVQALPNEIWMAGADGLEVLDASNGRGLRRIRHDPSMPSSLASNDIRALLKTRSGEIWVGGYGGGLQRHDPQPRGIRVMRHSPSRPETLSDPSVTALLALADGRIWVGTRGNGIDVLDQQRGVVASFRPQPDQAGALGSAWITAFAPAADGDIWVGGSRELYRYDARRAAFLAYGAPPQLLGQSLRRLLTAADGGLWIGTTRGLAHWSPQDDRIVAIVDQHGDALRTDVNALIEDDERRLWVGTGTGLYSVAPGTRQLLMVRSTPDLSQHSVVGMLLDAEGRLWVDTADGLHRLRRWADGLAEFEAVSRRHGIGGRPFGANLLDDRRGRIWTHRYMYDPSGDALYELSRADITDIGTGWFRSYAKSQDGLLLFGGSKGLLIIDPEQWRPWAYIPPLVVTEVKVDTRVQPMAPFGATLVLPPQKKGFSIEFAALDYSAPERNRYAYRLEGFEDDWIAADADHRSVGYNNLRPGEYRFRAKGTNRSGAWSTQQLDIPIRILPAYWQTSWFAGLVLLSLIGAVFAAHRLRVARLGAHARELKQLVEQRTGELRTANENLMSSNIDLEVANRELSSAHTRLVETKEQLVMQEKMASLGSLIAGVAHEINTPLGVAVTASSHLKEETERFKRRLDSGELRRDELVGYLGVAAESSAMVDANLARAAQLVRSFKQISVDRSLDERRKFDLAKYLPEVLESLRPMWRKRGVNFELDCQAGLELNSYPGTMAQIVANFVENALLHAFEEGISGTLRLQVHADGEQHVRIVFADDGKGIAAADINQIFDPFFTTRRGRGGTGLGLHIVFNLVNGRLGGQIEVESALGKGTRFKIRLPREAPV